IRNSVHGQRQRTEDCGKKSHGGVNEKESAKATPAKGAALSLAPISRAHRNIPEAARRSLSEARRVNPRASGSRSPSSVHGEKAAETLLAASGIPHPFHRSRRGSAPSFSASRVAFAHGRICVAMSLRYGFRGGPGLTEIQGTV